MSDSKKQNQGVVAIIQIAIVIAAIWYFFGGGLEKQADANLDQIKSQVAEDAVAQYRIAKNNGSAIDACVQAGMVTAAYLQAQNEAQYQSWKAIQSSDCANAGVPY